MDMYYIPRFDCGRSVAYLGVGVARVGIPGPGAYKAEDCIDRRFHTPQSAFFGSSGREGVGSVASHLTGLDWSAVVPGPGAYSTVFISWQQLPGRTLSLLVVFLLLNPQNNDHLFTYLPTCPG